MDLGNKLRSRVPAWLDRLGGNGRQPSYQLQRKQAGSSGVSFVGSGDWSQFFLLDGGAMPDADQLTKSIALATSAYAFTATDYRWRTVSEPPLQVVVDTEDGPEPIEGHRLAMLLDDPAPDYDMGTLQALTEAYQLITGAALWVKQTAGEMGRGELVRLVPYSGDQFRTAARDGRIYGRFWWVDTDQGRMEYTPDEVVHFREVNPFSWRTNLSKLDVALAQLDLGHQVNRMIRNYMRRAMFLGGVISPHADWNPDEDEFQQYVNRIKAWHGGPSKAGEPLVALGGTTFSATALSLKDLLPGELLDRIEATVAAIYGIPPVVLGWLVGLKNSPWSQMGEARRMTYEDTIEPRWHELEKAMTRQLLTVPERMAGQRVRFDTSKIRALQADDKERAEIATKLRDEWTRDERRIYTGQEALEDERGDEIGGGGGGGGGLFGGGLADAEEMGLGAIPELKALADERDLCWLLFDANTKASEGSWERQIYKALEGQKRDVVRLARLYLHPLKQGTDPGSADFFLSKLGQYMENVALPALMKLIYPLVFTTAKQAVRQAASKLQLSFTVFEPGLLRYAQRETAFLASVMKETSVESLTATIQKGLAEGDLVADLTKRLQTDMSFSRTRARLVARTETTRAWNGSQREGLANYQAESGRPVEKSWLSARDDRVREEHDELDDGEWYPIDYVFSNGLTEPGEPNCRCTLVYRIASNATA